MPDTVPVLPTVATEILLLVHVPPDAVSFNAVAEPTHTLPVPVIEPAKGNGSTVTTEVAYALPQLLVTK